MATSNKRLRILAERTLRLLDAYKAEHPPLSDVDAVLAPLASAFIEAYDVHHNFSAARREQVAAGKTRVAELQKLIRSWSSTMQTLLPGFTENTLRGNLNVPDSVLHDAKRLIALLADNVERLPSGAALLTQIAELHEAASREWNAAQRALAEHAQLLDRITVAREAFYGPFMGFRTTLGRLLGRTHRDYVQLRLDTSRQDTDASDMQHAQDAQGEPSESLQPEAATTRAINNNQAQAA